MEEIIIKSNGNSIYNTHKFIDYKKKDKCCGCYPSYKDLSVNQIVINLNLVSLHKLRPA
ncbi:MAG: hypothetical protein WAO64_05435 [Tissierellaceae bacterium]